MAVQIKTRILGIYGLLVVIVALLFIPLYGTTLNLQRQSTIHNMDETIQSATRALDIEITNLHHIASFVLTNPSFSTLMSNTAELNTEDHYKLRQSREYLSQLIRTFQYVSGISVVFRNGIIITDERAFTSLTEYYDTFMYMSPLKSDQWLSSMLLRANGMQPESPMFLYDNGEAERMTYIISLPYGTNSFRRGFLMGILAKADVLDFLGLPVPLDGYMLYMEDAMGNVLMRENYDDAPIDAQTLARGEGRYQGVKTVWREYPFMSGSLRFVLGIQESVFVRSVAAMQRLLITYAAVAVLIALAIAATLTYRQNKPIKKLLTAIHTAGIEDPGKRRDFEYIQYAIGELVSTRGRLETLTVQQRRQVAAGLFDRLIRDGLQGMDVTHAQGYLDEIPQRYRLIYMKLYERGASQPVPVRMMVADVLGGLFDSSTYVHATGQNGIVVVLAAEENKPFPSDTLAHIQEYCESQYATQTVAGISGEHVGLSQLHAAFKEARSALDRTDETVSVLFFEEINPAEHQIRVWHKANDKLYQVLLLGDLEATEACFAEVLTLYGQNSPMNSQGLRQLFYSIRGIGVSVCSELGLVESYAQMQEFEEDMTLAEAETALHAYIARICDEIGRRKSSHNNRLKEEIIRYVAEHYDDAMLNAEMIGDTFNISTKYVFNFVKEQTGVPLSALIENYRMDAAIRLLRETDMQLAVIAERVGYASANTFYKTFKRRYGVAPGQWRQAQGDVSAPR